MATVTRTGCGWGNVAKTSILLLLVCAFPVVVRAPSVVRSGFDVRILRPAPCLEHLVISVLLCMAHVSCMHSAALCWLPCPPQFSCGCLPFQACILSFCCCPASSHTCPCRAFTCGDMPALSFRGCVKHKCKHCPTLVRMEYTASLGDPQGKLLPAGTVTAMCASCTAVRHVCTLESQDGGTVPPTGYGETG